MSAQPLLETIGDPHCDSHDGVAQYFKRTLYKCYPLNLRAASCGPANPNFPANFKTSRLATWRYLQQRHRNRVKHHRLHK